MRRLLNYPYHKQLCITALEWLLERGFHRFKRGSLPALPIYFHAPRPHHWLDVCVKPGVAGVYPHGVCGAASTYRNSTI
jgi:hypothetical protein